MRISMLWIALLLALNVSAVETTLTDMQGATNWLYTPTEKADPAKTYWLVVGVHGVGGNGKEACGVAKWAGEFDDVIVLGPTFTQPPRDPDAPRPGMSAMYQMSGPTHEAKLQELVAEIGKKWKLHPKLIVHGFSAGAQFVHRFAFHHPELVAGVSAHSGGSWARLEGNDKINSEAKRIPFVVSCGEDDKGTGGPSGSPTRIEGVKQFAANLESLGFSVELKTWPGVAHAQTTEAKAMGKGLLEKVRQAGTLKVQ